jgi:Tetratricopeptide repeat
MLVKRGSCGSVATADRSTQSVVDFDKSILANRGDALTPPLSPLSQPSSCDDPPAAPSEPCCYCSEVSIRKQEVPKKKEHSEVDEAKPFFIMDWLEKVNDRDLELAQKMLRTPQKVSVMGAKASSAPMTASTSSLSGQDARSRPGRGGATTCTTPPRAPQHPSSSSASKAQHSGFRKRSIAIGNGWNAKGLQKARLGKWDAALSCWENALEIRIQVLGEAHPDVANTCNNMGIALGKLGRADEAMGHLKRALAIRVDRYGLRSPEVAATLHNMGNVLQQSGNLEAAIECFCETKKLQEQVHGPHHVQVARACVAIGQTYYQAGELADAREAYGDALAIFRSAGLDDDDGGGTNVEVRNVLEDVAELDKLLMPPRND